MTQLQKKCFVASSGVHGLLLVILVAAAVFHSETAVTEEQVLTIISPRLLDRAGSGGEAPAAVTPQMVTPPPAAPPAAAPPIRPIPVEPAPQPRPIVQAKAELPSETKPKVEKVTQEKPVAPEKIPTSAKTAPTKTHEIVPDLTRTTHIASSTTSSTKPSNSATSSAHSSTNAHPDEFAKALSELDTKIRGSAAQSTVVTVPGEGGGEAFTGYEAYIQSTYTHAWKSPDGATQNFPTADVKIVVGRDGTIFSAELTGSSGDAATDRSVQRTLNSVTKLRPFPEGAQDAQRTFHIRFNLDVKQSNG
jgi:TonB family protein